MEYIFTKRTQGEKNVALVLLLKGYLLLTGQLLSLSSRDLMFMSCAEFHFLSVNMKNDAPLVLFFLVPII
jgi:hypothetical protein